MSKNVISETNSELFFLDDMTTNSQDIGFLTSSNSNDINIDVRKSNYDAKFIQKFIKMIQIMLG